jgi:hypothetical protein
MTRRLIALVAGAPGRLALSAAATATVALTAAGRFPDLVVSAAFLLAWGTIFGLAFLTLAVAGNIAGVYDDAPAPPPQQGGPHAQG